MKSVYKSISDHVFDLSYEDTAVSMNRLTDCASPSYIRITLFTMYDGFTVGVGGLTCTEGTPVQTAGCGLCRSGLTWILYVCFNCVKTHEWKKPHFYLRSRTKFNIGQFGKTHKYV